MKRTSLNLCLLSVLIAPVASAQIVASTSGQAITRGKVASMHDFSSLRHNPASANYLLPSGSGFDVNMVGPFGGGYELGKVDDLLDELDELIDILDQDNLSAQDALDAKERFDPFLQDAEVDGSLKVLGFASVPLFPITYRLNEDHAFYADFQFGGSMRATVLADDIDIVGFNDTFVINTDAAVYVKSLGLVSFGLGYAGTLYEYEDATVHGGAKLNINRFALAKNIISLAGLEDGEDIGDAIRDDYENNANSSVNVGLDVGIEVVSKYYQIGLSISDVNEPEYDYGSLRSDCQNLSGISLDNCIVAQNVIADGLIRADETYQATAQATLSGSFTVGENNGLVIAGSYDLNEKNDPIGDPYQWAHLSATSYFQSALIPELRLGYSQNLTGAELSYYAVGFTLFKYLDFDLAWSDEEVVIDDSEMPRSLFFSLSFQSQF